LRRLLDYNKEDVINLKEDVINLKALKGILP